MPTKLGPWESGSRRTSPSNRHQGPSSSGQLLHLLLILLLFLLFFLTLMTLINVIIKLCCYHRFFWQDFVKNLVTDGLGVELNNKVNEMNLILANHISDKVIDDVIDNLSR